MSSVKDWAHKVSGEVSTPSTHSDKDAACQGGGELFNVINTKNFSKF